MKTYFMAAAVIRFYNALTSADTVATVTEKFRTRPYPTKRAATDEILEQSSRKQWLYQLPDGAVEVLQMRICLVNVLENEEEKERRHMAINVRKKALLRELIKGQEIKPSIGKYWEFDENSEPKLVRFFELREGYINPCFEEEIGTNKWYYLDNETCLFTGNDKCKKHIAKHKDIWFKFI